MLIVEVAKQKISLGSLFFEGIKTVFLETSIDNCLIHRQPKVIPLVFYFFFWLRILKWQWPLFSISTFAF